MKDEKKQRKWLGAYVDDSLHNSLMRVASEKGVHPTALMEEALRQYIAHYARTVGKNVDPIVMVTAMALDEEVRESGLRTLQSMALRYIRNPTEAGADKLRTACDAMEIELEDLITDLRENEQLVTLVDELDRPLTKAEAWLRERMKPDTEYPMKLIKAESEMMGIKFYTLTKAKETLRIRSIRRSGHWVWIRPVEEEKVTEQRKQEFERALEKLKPNVGIYVSQPDDQKPF